MPFELSYFPLLLASLLIGFLFGFLWEILRILRRAIPHPAFVVALEDIFFFIVTSFFFWCISFSFAYGRIRWFSLTAVVLGFCGYLCSLGIVLTRVSESLIAGIKALFSFLIGRILLPLLRRLSQLSRIVLRPLIYFFQSAVGILIRLRRYVQIRSLLHFASRGFS